MTTQVGITKCDAAIVDNTKIQTTSSDVFLKPTVEVCGTFFFSVGSREAGSRTPVFLR